MRGIPTRFRIQKVLRDHSIAKTFSALDTSSNDAEMLIKIFRKERYRHEQTEAPRVLSCFSGLRHQRIIPIVEAGLTQSGDFYTVREYIIEAALSPNVQHYRQLLATVLFLNSIGFVHGAIRPSNI